MQRDCGEVSSALPDAVRRWVCDVTGAQLTDVAVLPGATSSLVALLGFDDRTELVLRLHTKDDWLAHEPDIATREAHALRALAGSDVPAPALVAVDESGEFCGRPAVLMTRLRGRAELGNASANRLSALAHVLRPLHRRAAPPELPAYRPYLAPSERIVPRWTSIPDVWAQAIEVCAHPVPSGPIVFIHRDYHAGNVLAEGGLITGIVDWPNACAGPMEIDIAHCRLNLALVHGLAAANAFVAETGTDPRRQAYWDLVDALDMLWEEAHTGEDVADLKMLDALHAMGSPALTPALVHRRFDEFVADALRRWECEAS